MEQKGSSWKKDFHKRFFKTAFLVRTATPYNTHEPAHATCPATCEDIMAGKLAEERFCSERSSYLQRIKRLPSLTAMPIYVLPTNQN